MKTVIPALIAFLSLATGPLLACAPRVCVSSFKPKVVALVTPVFPTEAVVLAKVPAYGSRVPGPEFYVAEVGNELQRQQVEQNKQIIELLKQLLVEKQAAPVATPALDGKALTVTYCAACHTPPFAEAKGGDFVLLEANGKVPEFSVQHQAQIPKRMRAGSMPEPRWLAEKKLPAPTPEQQKAISDFLLAKYLKKE